MLVFRVKKKGKLVPLCKQKVLITVKAPAAVSFSGRLCKRAVVRFGTYATCVKPDVGLSPAVTDLCQAVCFLAS